MDDQIRPRPQKPVVSPAVGFFDGRRRWLCALREADYEQLGPANPVGIGLSVDEAYRHWREAHRSMMASMDLAEWRAKPWL